jgi:hypothetical protein
MVGLVDTTKQMKQFLELVQPLPVRYGYVRGVAEETSYVTYRNMSSTPRIGIGNQLISERATFVVTVQTKTAEQNLIYSAMIKYGTQESDVIFISDDLRRDVTVERGWINTIIVSTYSSIDADKQVYKSAEVQEMLQSIADRYIMITSVYKEPYAESIIDKFKVPDLEDRLYSLAEIIALKQEYIDRYILTITEH